MPAELFHCLYGALVAHTTRHGNPSALFQLGQRIGARLVDDLCAKCPHLATVFTEGPFADAADSFSKCFFKMYFNMTVQTRQVGEKVFVVLDDGLTRSVQLPDELIDKQDFHYLLPYCGIVQKGLEEVGWRVECRMGKDALKGDDCTEMEILFKERVAEERPPSDD